MMNTIMNIMMSPIMAEHDEHSNITIVIMIASPDIKQSSFHLPMRQIISSNLNKSTLDILTSGSSSHII